MLPLHPRENRHLKGMCSKTCSLINNNSEIYISCRDKTWFHQFPNNSPVTDESIHGRKSSDNSREPRIAERSSVGSINNSSSYSSISNTCATIAPTVGIMYTITDM